MLIEDVKTTICRILQLGERSKHMDAESGLFGTIPEFDSMAVVNVVGALEERFGITIEDEEITADTFQTVGSLTRFVESKLAG